ncbi:MAG: FeS assembly SUF system protein [Rhodospirillaceae bacterium]|nr:FeS assembly SUF system protein [Rhodospirillaceae bacterium]|tara:strand:+ start:391 stop:738 length:348 start_codon:yes stop_codon:yes gene_type:complete
MVDPIIYSEKNSCNDKGPISDAVIAALKSVKDPEIPIDIYELGLIYDVKVQEDHINVLMTLTAPGCPVAGTLPRMVELALLTVKGINTAKVEIVWEPPWNSSMMSEGARLELGME